ncbi:unnamed protein product [Chondrus crispus]|uniref:Ubiquitin-like domain-containing protein n=1 Tax=Chondrus crispus TaxID=2769 RepID=R7QAY9_CHOCR|nr:unnamed protein product [Chondrus crispus]CDF35239.1 unnamed protein product [Chondrus crispus]|eukprot:XP_005715058.1 unnamed protein product [Chondrus crispus]
MSSPSNPPVDASSPEGTESAESPMFNILVKNPTDRPGSMPFTLDVNVKATVRNLKELLTSSYPGSPSVTSQRLIYAGKLLKDSHSLETILTSTDRPAQHIIHLVVSSRHRAAAATSRASTSRTSTLAGSSAVPYQSSAPSSSPVPPSYPHPNTAPPQNYNNMFHPYVAFQQYPPGVEGQRYPYPPVPGVPPPDPSMYPLPYPPPQFPYPPPPSDVPGNVQAHRNAPQGPLPFAPMDQASYAAHLQAMERIIGDGLAAQYTGAQEAAAAAAARGVREGADARVAAQAAAAAVMHAQAHIQAWTDLNAGLRNNAAPAPPQNRPQGPDAGLGFQFGIGNGAEEGMHQNLNPQENHGIEHDGARVRRYVFHFEVNWTLILKLIFVVYLLGQEGTPRRVYILLSLALVIYLWQTNRLGFLGRIAGIALPNPVQLFEAFFPRVQGPNEEGTQASQSDQDPNAQSPRGSSRFGRGAVVLCFIYSFFYGFVGSLLPAWRPPALPRVEELLHPAENENDNNHGLQDGPREVDDRRDVQAGAE